MSSGWPSPKGGEAMTTYELILAIINAVRLICDVIISFYTIKKDNRSR
ncbi:MAG: hypothetical protein LBI03_05890 [Clostridiales bacterium]|nr:hypothetical protein [Clostridiales bacterium]